jgi:hypothetical protein
MNKDVKLLAEVYGLVHDKSLKIIPGRKVKFTDPESKKEITGTVSNRKPDQMRPGQKWEPTDLVITDLMGKNYIMPEHMLAVVV